MVITSMGDVAACICVPSREVGRLCLPTSHKEHNIHTHIQHAATVYSRIQSALVFADFLNEKKS